MFANFGKALQEVLGVEGGRANNKHDNGGRTNYGITQATYDAYRLRMSQPEQSVYQIDQNELESIYRNSYWNIVRGDDLPSGIDLAVFDFAVNSGPVRAVRELQKVLGVNTDGQVGNLTLSAVRSRDAGALIDAYQAARLAYVESLDDFKYFGKGWKSRIERIRKVARGYATGNNPVVPPPLADGAAEKADPRKLKVSKTTTGKGTITTTIGVAGSAVTDAAHQISPMASVSTALQIVFVLLTIAGLGLTIYGLLHSIQRQGVA